MRNGSTNMQTKKASRAIIQSSQKNSFTETSLCRYLVSQIGRLYVYMEVLIYSVYTVA